MNSSLALSPLIVPETNFELNLLYASSQVLGFLSDNHTYHCIDHAIGVTRAFDEIAYSALQRNMITREDYFLGIYGSITHDGIFNDPYKCTKGKNERESTKLANHHLSYYGGFAYEDQESIGKMHDSTVLHEVGANGIISSPGSRYVDRLIVDADLHAVGSEWPIAQKWMYRFRDEETVGNPSHPFLDDNTFYEFEAMIHRGHRYLTTEAMLQFWQGSLNAGKISKLITDN